MDDDKGSKLRPTIIEPPRRKPPQAVTTGTAAPKPAVSPTPVLKPTMVAGTARERMAVAAGDLNAFSPGTTRAVIDRAVAMLAGFVIDRANDKGAILWGHDVQKRHASLVSVALELSQAPVVQRTQGYVARMLDILGQFDLSGLVRQDGAGLGGLLKSLNRKTDTVAELASARRELDQLVSLLAGSMDELLALKEKIEENAAANDGMALDAEAGALAALYLSERLRADKPAVAERFVERSMSLTQTLAQIRSNDGLRRMQVEHPLRMIQAIQSVTLVSMPDFLAGLAAMNTLAARNTPITPTDADELTYKLRDIVRQLQN